LFCNNCGYNLRDGETVCPNCNAMQPELSSSGARLKSTFGGKKAYGDMSSSYGYDSSSGSYTSPPTETYNPTTMGATSYSGGEYTGTTPYSTGEYTGTTPYSTGGYSGADPYSGAYNPVPSTPGYYSSGYDYSRSTYNPKTTSGRWIARIVVAVILVLFVFILPTGNGDDTAGKDMIEPCLDVLGTMVENLGDVFADFDKEGIVQFFIGSVCWSIGGLMYVIASLGVLIAAIINGKRIGISFSTTGALGAVLYVLGLLIIADGNLDMLDGLGFGLFVNMALYIASAALASKK